MLLLIAGMAVGCTTATVSLGTTAAPVGTTRPAQIVVYDFAVSAAEVTQDQGILQRAYRAVATDAGQQQASQLQTGHDAVAALSDGLVKRFTDLGFNARRQPRGTTPPDGAVIIEGEFLNIDEGNRLRRLVIGFGAGASKLDTQVNVYQVANGATSTLLDFKTHAESGKMPGAAMTMGLGAAAQGGPTVAAGAASAGLGGVKTYASTTGYLADSTAKQVVAYFSQYAAAQGWMSEDEAQKASVENSQ